MKGASAPSAFLLSSHRKSLVMNLSSIRDFLSGQLWQLPQKLHSAHAAIDAIEAAIIELAKIGHQFMLVPMTAANQPDPILYPKMLYNKEKTTIVEDPEAEGRLIAIGWKTTPEEGKLEHPAPVTLAPEVPKEAPTSPPATISKSFDTKKGG